MDNLAAFSEELRQRISILADSTQNFTRAALAELAGGWLEDEGEIEEFVPSYYEAHGIQVDGYGLSEQNDSIDLFLVDYIFDSDKTTLSATELNQGFKRLLRFFGQAVSRNLHQELDFSSPAYGMAWTIRERAASLGRLRLFIVSNRLLSRRVESLPPTTLDSWQVSYHVWDLQRLSRLHETRPEPILIDLREEPFHPVQCLPAHLPSGDYRSYLVVIPGHVLARLYGRYGARLLELNVRTFLQARGNVNKGIRNTILNEPQMFFAYNNGITATADEVVTETRDGLERIVSLSNLQIVNGGQTTASLYHASRNKADLSGVFVQMKLSVVQPDIAPQVAPKIAEYANTQNKVSAADFFSNHAFHVRMEEMSRRIWAPAVESAQRQTKWFYERARGQYAEAQSALTTAETRAWQMEYPKGQVFTKTDLAKYENVWEGYPVEVNRGAQKNFASFAQRICSLWDENDTTFGDRFFKRAVARCLIFRETEKLVSRQPWYQGGYRANIVAYSQALLSVLATRYKKVPDWDGIWSRQGITPAFGQAIAGCAQKVNSFIVATPDSIRNVTEWCKKQACWEGIQRLDVDLSEAFLAELLPVAEENRRERDAQGQRAMDNGIEAQQEVFSLGAPFWAQLDDYCRSRRIPMTSKERSILETATRMPRALPSDRQSLMLMELLRRVEKEGFTWGAN